MTTSAKDFLTALAVGGCFLLIALLAGFEPPLLIAFPAATFLLFWGARVWRRRRGAPEKAPLRWEREPDVNKSMRQEVGGRTRATASRLKASDVTRQIRRLVPATFALAVILPGCSSAGGSPSEGTSPTQVPAEQTAVEPPDLTGTWTQTNSESAHDYQTAVVGDGVITVSWFLDGGDTTGLYWSGAYEAPTGSSETFEWTPIADTEKTRGSLLASSEPSKSFTDENDSIHYSSSVAGVTTKVALARE
jgi:hypothetical protein